MLFIDLYFPKLMSNYHLAILGQNEVYLLPLLPETPSQKCGA